METWYLMYDGHSADGRSNRYDNPRYIGRTLDKGVAEDFLERNRGDHYWIGHVLEVSDSGLAIVTGKNALK